MDNKTFEKLVLSAMSDKMKRKDVKGHINELLNILKHDPPTTVKFFMDNAEFIKKNIPTYAEYVTAIHLCVERESFGQVWSLIDSMQKATFGIDARIKLSQSQCKIETPTFQA